MAYRVFGLLLIAFLWAGMVSAFAEKIGGP